MVGYGGTNQYRRWDPMKDDIYIRRDVIICDQSDVSTAERVILSTPGYESTKEIPSTESDTASESDLDDELDIIAEEVTIVLRRSERQLNPEDSSQKRIITINLIDIQQSLRDQMSIAMVTHWRHCRLKQKRYTCVYVLMSNVTGYSIN